MTIQTIEEETLPVPLARPREEERHRIVEFVRKWGGIATDALLDPATQIFSIPHVEGFIGYRMEYGCAVVYGDPVCAPDQAPRLAQAFHDSLQGQCRNIIYLITSKQFAKWAIPHVCKASLEYGEEIFLDPHDNPKEKHGNHASLVRRKVRHAEKKGVSVKEYFSYDTRIEQALEQVGAAWLESRKGPQLHISHIHLFDNRFGKRWFYAEQGEKIIGMAVLNQVQSRQGWHLNHLMVKPQAPNGTPELLIVSVLEILQKENCTFVSFGAAPLNQLGEITGLSSFSTWATRQVYKIAEKFFRLGGHKMFWGKFFPQTQPSYLLFARPHIGLREIAALLRATNISI